MLSFVFLALFFVILFSFPSSCSASVSSLFPPSSFSPSSFSSSSSLLLLLLVILLLLFAFFVFLHFVVVRVVLVLVLVSGPRSADGLVFQNFLRPTPNLGGEFVMGELCVSLV